LTVKVVPAQKQLEQLVSASGELRALVAHGIAVVQELQEAGHEAYFVGGAVRDILLGRPFHEVDITTSARPDEVQQLFRRTIPMGEAFGVITVMRAGHAFEVATFRCEEGYSDGRHPDQVTVGTLAQDVERRDFTINGLVLDPLRGDVLDFVGGIEDLRKGVVRAIGDPLARMSEDFLRTVRAVRFAACLDFAMEQDTLAAVRDAASGLDRISRERIRNEIEKLVAYRKVPAGLRLLGEAALSRGVFGPDADAAAMARAAYLLEGLTPAPDLPDTLAAVTLAIGATAGTVVPSDAGSRTLATAQAEGLRLSNVARRRLTELYLVLATLPTLTGERLGRRAETYRSPAFATAAHLLRRLHSDDDGQLAELATHVAQAAALTPHQLAGQSPVSGADLLALGYQAGPQLGELLKELSYLVVEGTIASREDAMAWLQGQPSSRG
jgi:tRNA nucleotidyltransferase (CCA-adding enzyme)